MGKLIDGDPQQLGAYWLAGRLGTGGQGVVYEGYGEDGRRVAIKVLHGDQTAQLVREAEAAQRVAAFCTAGVIEARLDGPRPYIVSEYVEGPSLRKAVADGRRFQGGDLHRLATAIATALTAIHDAGVVHRDLKPDNVLLGPDGPRVIDFGVARTAEMSLTTTGLVTGTPMYMAPEVFTGQRAGAPADVFAWGAILVFAASGADPYEADNLGSVMHRVLSSVPDLSAVPDSLRPMVSAALGKEPAERPTARELLLALVSGDARLDTARLLARGGHEAAGVAVAADDPALGTLAEDAYQLLDPAERELAPEVFLRLVTVGARGELSVRPAALAEILEGRPLPEVAAAKRVLEVFGYLLTRTEEEVTLARPALPHAWPRYRRWIEANRDGLAVHREILTAAYRWVASGRRDGDLFQGSSLENALQWAATARRNITLSTAERDFLEAGAQLSRRRARRNRLTSMSLAGLLVIALAAVGLAVQQGRLADDRADRIAGQLRTSEADRLATLAATTRRTDPMLAALFSATAWRLDQTPHTRAELTTSMAQRDTGMFRDPATSPDTLRAISGDGRTLVSAGQDEARLWDLRTGRRSGGIRGLGFKDEQVVAAALSHSGRTFVAVSAGRARAWDTASGRQLHTLAFATPLDLINDWIEVAFFDESAPILLSADKGTRWDLRTGATRPSRFRSGDVVSPDGRWLAQQIGSPDPKRVLLTGLRDRRTEELGDLDGAGTQGVWNRGLPAFSGDGRLVATLARTSVQFWRMSDTQLISSVPVRGEAESEAQPLGAFDGRTFRYLVADQVFSVDIGDLAAERDDVVNLAVLAPDGARVLVSAVIRGAELRPVRGGGAPIRLPEAANATFSPDGRLFVLHTDDRKITVVEDGKRHTFAPGEEMGLELISFSPDGNRLAASLTAPDSKGGEEHQVQVWDWRARRLLWWARQNEQALTAFSPDGKRLAVGGRQVTLVDAATGAPAGPPFAGTGRESAVTGLHFNRSGSTLAVVDSRLRMTVWDTTTARPLGRVSNGVGGVSASSPREDLIAAWEAGDGRIRLFDPMSGTTLATLRDLGGGQDPEVRETMSVAFSGDGSTLLTTDRNGVVREHPVGGAKVLAAVCARVGRSLSAEEWRAHLAPGLPYLKACS